MERGELLLSRNQEFTNKTIDITRFFCYNNRRSEFVSAKETRKETSMNITNGMKALKSSWENYRHSDPVIVKKTFSMKDVVYRKNTPECEIWRSEVHFDRDIYMIFLVLAASGAVMYFTVRKLLKKCRECTPDPTCCK